MKRSPWKVITTVREIRALVSGLKVSFAQSNRTVNGVADYFAKNGVNGSVTSVFRL